MREKIVLRRRTSPKEVTLTNGTTFTVRYERISRKQLPINIHVKKTRKIGTQNRNKSEIGPEPTRPGRVTKKRVRFTPSNSLRERLAAKINWYRASRHGQTGSGLDSNLAKTGLTMGSKAINYALGKKIINKGIDNIVNMFEYGVSKIKNKKFQRALNSDIANYVVDEAQNKIKNRTHMLFDNYE